MHEPEFARGFRLTAVDVAFLVLGAAGAAVASSYLGVLGLIIGLAVFHFFIFCNVFRICRASELLWATIFVATFGSTLLVEKPGWLISLVVSVASAAILIVLEMRKPSYHGIFWKKVNPNLPSWWDRKSS